MPEITPIANSLVLYKSRPARVLSVADKLEIELEGGKTKRVRPKDVALLHPGPLQSLATLTPRSGEVEDAWELLTGGTTELVELTELIFGDHTPGTAWAAWQLVADGLYFRGTPDLVEARSAEEVESERATREAKATAEKDWAAFIARLQSRALLPEDGKNLSDAVTLAHGGATRSRVLRELGYPESAESAHEFLLRVGFWSETVNPYPQRLAVPCEPPALELPELPEEERLDLTELPAFAIDDEGNQDPDDALSLEGDRLWVHVADVAAVARPGSALDAEAQARGANLYLPDRVASMLPPGATELLGLGLKEISPALSFAITLNSEGEMVDVDVVRSWIRVTRLTYQSVEQRLGEAPFKRLFAIAQSYRKRREERGATVIDLPEVTLRVVADGIVIRPLVRLDSRELVTNAMLMAGEAAARFARERDIPIPYATQAAPDNIERPQGLAAMFAYRKKLKPSQVRNVAEPHAGLGLDAYTRATSPLRRYSDLLVHQQLRAHLRGEDLFDPSEIAARLATAEPGSAAVRRAERLSNMHWKLVFLMRHPGWRGRGILIEKNGQRGKVIIPELALEARVQLHGDPALDSVLSLSSPKVDLPKLWTSFRTSTR